MPIPPPNFEEVEGAYWFGSVRPPSPVQTSAVRELRLAIGQEQLELGSCLVCSLYTKIKRTHIFFSGRFKGLGAHSVRVMSLFNS